MSAILNMRRINSESCWVCYNVNLTKMFYPLPCLIAFTKLFLEPRLRKTSLGYPGRSGDCKGLRQPSFPCSRSPVSNTETFLQSMFSGADVSFDPQWDFSEAEEFHPDPQFPWSEAPRTVLQQWWKLGAIKAPSNFSEMVNYPLKGKFTVFLLYSPIFLTCDQGRIKLFSQGGGPESAPVARRKKILGPTLDILGPLWICMTLGQTFILSF